MILGGARWYEMVSNGGSGVSLHVVSADGAAAGVWHVGSGWGELDGMGRLLDLGTGLWRALGCSVE